MFPHSDDVPSLAPKRPVNHTISPPICLQLSLPEDSIAYGGVYVLGTCVPEAAVYKEGDSELRKDEIWRAEDLPVPTPSCDAKFAKHQDHCQFGLLISATANPRHDLRAFFFGEHVCHANC